jgi:chromosome segregation ATPase
MNRGAIGVFEDKLVTTVWAGVVATTSAIYALVRWVFSERSQVLRERSELHRELMAELRRQMRALEDLRRSFAAITEELQRERDMRIDAEQRVHELEMKLASVQRSLELAMETATSLREICERHGIKL